MIFRKLQSTDYERGYLDLLKQLTVVGTVTKEHFLNTFLHIKANNYHNIYVIEINEKIIACGTLLIEPKFIHECGFVGHIEDIVVSKEYRGQNIGKKMIRFLTKNAQKGKCYKVLLNCKGECIDFYKKCDYDVFGFSLAKYLK